MQDDLIVQNSKQLQVLGSPIRVKMLEHLCREPLTATQLGHLMDMAPARAHYHLKQLDAVGLVQLIERRETSGIVEKYYRAVARRFHLDRTVAYDPEGRAATRHVLQIEIDSAVQTFERRLQEYADLTGDSALPPSVLGGVLELKLTPARYERLLARLRALLREFESDSQGNWPSTQLYRILLLAYPDTPQPEK